MINTVTVKIHTRSMVGISGCYCFRGNGNEDVSVEKLMTLSTY